MISLMFWQVRVQRVIIILTMLRSPRFFRSNLLLTFFRDVIGLTLAGHHGNRPQVKISESHVVIIQ
jgi:hypothetical protein